MCDIGYLIEDHIPAIMQLMTHKLPDYNMQLVTSKCLNTAVMMMYLMLGEEALQMTSYCEVPNVQARQNVTKHRKDCKHRLEVMKNLKKQLFANVDRALFYVMITDGQMLLPSATTAPNSSKNANVNAKGNGNANGNANAKAKTKPEGIMFPGHVFVIERVPRIEVPRNCTFNIYQSYIYHYDLAEHIDANESLSVGFKGMDEIMEGLCCIMEKDVWDDECAKAWMKLTHTPYSHASKWKGCVKAPSTMLPCFAERQTDKCITNLNSLIKEGLEHLRDSKIHPDQSVIYGSKNMFPNPDPKTTGAPPRPQPLTVAQMIDQLEKLQSKLE